MIEHLLHVHLLHVLVFFYYKYYQSQNKFGVTTLFFKGAEINIL